MPFVRTRNLLPFQRSLRLRRRGRVISMARRLYSNRYGHSMNPVFTPRVLARLQVAARAIAARRRRLGRSRTNEAPYIP